MPCVKCKSKVLIDLFPPWKKAEISITGAAAELFAVVVAVTLVLGMPENTVVNIKSGMGSAVYAIIRNFI